MLEYWNPQHQIQHNNNNCVFFCLWDSKCTLEASSDNLTAQTQAVLRNCTVFLGTMWSRTLEFLGEKNTFCCQDAPHTAAIPPWPLVKFLPQRGHLHWRVVLKIFSMDKVNVLLFKCAQEPEVWVGTGCLKIYGQNCVWKLRDSLINMAMSNKIAKNIDILCIIMK